MLWLVAALVLISLLRIAQTLLPFSRRAAHSPYIRYLSLFSTAEMAFLEALDRAVGRHYRIFAKTRIADVVDLRPDIDPYERRRAFNRIGSKHFDFVLCNPRDFSIAGVVELNDASHLRQERAARDAFVIDVCNAIGLPIVMVRARHQYSTLELRSVIEQALYD